MSIAWLGWGRASGGSASAEHRIALHYTARAKVTEASQRLSTTAHGNGNEQLRPAPRRHDIAPRRQIMVTQSGGRAVNLCARDWQGKAGNRHGIARPRTATALVGPAPLCNGSVEQCGAWHGEEMPLRRQGAADIGAQTQRTTNYPFSRGAGLRTALRRTHEREDGRMSITDELREWMNDSYPAWTKLRTGVSNQLDRIDKAHEEALSRLYMDMSDSEWVRLPKDADGEYVHIGDRMESGDGDVFIVSSVDYGLHSSHGRGKFWMLWSEDADFYERADECRHHKQPTVEDVLWDMHVKLDEVAALHADEPADSDERDSDEARIFAEYAAKLRLAGSDAE